MISLLSEIARLGISPTGIVRMRGMVSPNTVFSDVSSWEHGTGWVSSVIVS